jgi:rsbT co-antagonist protein RsbR
VPVVDTHTAQAILQVASATSKLGAQTILVGIRPEVAQALVSLGVAMSSIRTAATLQEGLTLVRDLTQRATSRQPAAARANQRA